MATLNPSESTIYTLSDETGVRYIGKTGYDPKGRLASHIYEAKRARLGTNYRCNWLKYINFRPSLGVLLTVKTRRAAALERMAIALYRACGARLVNQTDGGEGTPGLPRNQISSESRERMRDAALRRRGGLQVASSRPPAWNRGIPLPMATRAKISAALMGHRGFWLGKKRGPMRHYLRNGVRR